MGIADDARRAAEAREGLGPHADPMQPPDDAEWRALEEAVHSSLSAVLGADAGPAQRFEPRTARQRSLGNLPAGATTRRFLLFYPEPGLEILARRGTGKRPFEFYVVHRSANANEEALLSPFRDRASLGEAVG